LHARKRRAAKQSCEEFWTGARAQTAAAQKCVKNGRVGYFVLFLSICGLKWLLFFEHHSIIFIISDNTRKLSSNTPHEKKRKKTRRRKKW
jgi:hypothetical protein